MRTNSPSPVSAHAQDLLNFKFEQLNIISKFCLIVPYGRLFTNEEGRGYSKWSMHVNLYFLCTPCWYQICFMCSSLWDVEKIKKTKIPHWIICDVIFFMISTYRYYCPYPINPVLHLHACEHWAEPESLSLRKHACMHQYCIWYLVNNNISDSVT